MNSTLSNMKAYGEMCYNFNEFFILFSLIPLLVSSSFFSQTPINSLISMPTPTPTHHFHTDLSLAVVFLFSFFFGCGLMGGLGNGWLRMDRLVVGGSDGQIGVHHATPPISHPQIKLPCFFFFFLVDVGWVSWVLMGWCWWVMAMGGLIFMGCDGWCWWVWVDFGFWLILDFSYGDRW